MLSHNAIFRLFRSASGGGADSGVIGVNGSVNSSSARAILHELDAKNRTILDFGAGDGKFLICASVAGANHAIGIEFAENIGHKLLFDAVVHCILRRYSFRPSVQWIGLNIDQVRKIRMINRTQFLTLSQFLTWRLIEFECFLVRWLKFLKDPIACIVFGLVFR
jgi:hypothetical protein